MHSTLTTTPRLAPTSVVHVSESALKNNFEYLKSVIGDRCKISHVVKGNAYGHGIETYVPLAKKHGAWHFSVFDAHEAEQVHRVAGNEVTIMIMGMIDDDQLEWAIENGVEYFVFDKQRLENSVKWAQKIGKKACVHIELETGMNRTGFQKDNWYETAKYVKENEKWLCLKGMCTHYAGAESIANFIRVYDQYDNFLAGVKEFEKAQLNAEKLHTACSAASVRIPKTRMDMVRIGILQYGFWPSTETFVNTVGLKNKGKDPLQRLITWKSQVMNIKTVPMGEYIGYGNSFLATSEMKVAAVPVGYGHGFSRSLSNMGRVLIRGQRMSVIGMVNMNAMMVDVCDLDNVEIGDEVVLIGCQGELDITVNAFGSFSDQMNYELLTRLPLDIPRTVVE